MRRITVCLTNWRREAKLRETIKSLKCQTVNPSIFLWNNGERSDFADIDWLVESSLNRKCIPRWFMAMFAETEFVCIIDDDIILNDKNVLEDIIEIASENDDNIIYGISGVRLQLGKTYSTSEHVFSYKGEALYDNISVDIVKGSFMFMKAQSMRKLVDISMITVDTCDDIYVSSFMTKKRRQHLCLSSFRDRFVHTGDDIHALWRSEDHFLSRNRVSASAFKEYKLLEI